MAEANSIGVDLASDAVIQRALTCACYRLLDFVTEEWCDLVPDLLCRLGPIARGLPPGLSLSDRYGPPVTEVEEPSSSSIAPSAAALPAAPSPLLEIFALREALRETWDVPWECARVVQTEAGNVLDAREQYRRTLAQDAPRVDRSAARRQFIAAFITLHAAVIDAELRLLERQAGWDRLVFLLRGDWFFTDFPFDIDTYEYEEPRVAWFQALSVDIRNRPL